MKKIFDMAAHRQVTRFILIACFCILVVRDMQEEGLYTIDVPARAKVVSRNMYKGLDQEGKVESHHTKKTQNRGFGLKHRSLAIRDLIEAHYDRSVNTYLFMQDMEN